MRLLIDGYNLLHASGILGHGVGPGGLERSRQALLNFLVASLDPDDVKHTVVVFDAKMAPPGLPREVDHAGLTVRFAAKHSTADELIAELIKLESSPRRLTVVSSDHQVQRAARRRKAMAVDSDKWHAEVLRRRIERLPAEERHSKPGGPSSPGEIEYWVRQFEGQDIEQTSRNNPETEPSEPGGKPRAPLNQSLQSPFPPGYAEDIGEDNV